MIIQELLNIDRSICDEPEMYYRRENLKLSLNTYFNAFSIGKWKKYTNLNDLHLHIKLSNVATVRAYNAIGKAEHPETDNSFFTARSGNSLAEAAVSCSKSEIEVEVTEGGSVGEYDIEFSRLPEDGILFVEFTSTNNESLDLVEGYYYTNTVVVNGNIKLALGICTYKREQFLSNNLNAIKTHILDNPDSVLKDKVDIFVADNGRTILEGSELFDSILLNNSHINIYPNKNAGGASGFTRTIIEAFFNNKDKNYSHIILMDDDIVLYPKVLERTFMFLSYMKPQYKDCMIGAEMFCLNERYIQFEAGAQCRGISTGFFHKMWDMRDEKAVAANEELTPINYSGWWYNAIPRSVVSESNLPLPLFIHYDDVEYGMRNKLSGNDTILLNGICVWHPQGIGKANVSMRYYDVRNVLISMAGTPCEVKAEEIKSNLFKRIVSGILRYRYNDAWAAVQAVRDYYNGPEEFANMNPEEKHAAVMKLNYKSITSEEAGINVSRMKTKSKKIEGINKYFALATCAFCQFLPARKSIKVCGITGLGMAYSASEVFHYDKETGMGVLLKRDRKEMFSLLREYRQLAKNIKTSHSAINHRWAEYKRKLISVEQWKQYLEL